MKYAVAVALLILAQAELLSRVLAGREVVLLLPLVAVVGLRAGVGWARGVAGRKAAAARKEALRVRLLRATTAAVRSGEADTGETITLLGRGLDALDAYVAGYLPQRAVAVVVPLAVVGRLAVADWPSALTIALTLPLIPIFGALIGLRTRAVTERQWALLQRLGGHFLDVVTGLSTLRSYGRDRAQIEVVREMADGHRRATISTLKIAFLSALVLELVATLSVALVAVPAGLRLLGGTLSLRTALLILLLTPEAYLPLRLLGTRFHAGAEGKAVMDQVTALAPEPVGAARTGPGHGEGRPDRAAITVDRVTVRYAGRPVPAIDRVSLTVERGEHVALTGPSGAGKSTLLEVVLGLREPKVGGGGPEPLRGRIRYSGRVVVDRSAIAYVPQHPHLFACSVADNIRLGRPDADLLAVMEAAEAAAAHEFISDLPAGYDTVLGERGFGLSTGQRQRIAIARAYLLDAPIIVLDEPTARLDLAAEAAVVSAAERLLEGRTALLVAHRPALLTLADRVLHMSEGTLLNESMERNPA